jgi:hypothetical protein
MSPPQFSYFLLRWFKVVLIRQKENYRFRFASLQVFLRNVHKSMFIFITFFSCRSIIVYNCEFILPLRRNYFINTLYHQPLNITPNILTFLRLYLDIHTLLQVGYKGMLIAYNRTQFYALSCNAQQFSLSNLNSV